MSELLDDEDIDAALRRLPGWSRDGDSLRTTLTAPGFIEAIALVDAVAVAAEHAQHHPDIDIRWRVVTFVLATHSAGGITAKDVELATVISALGAERGATAG